jgi:hypothetical protein
VKLPKQDAEALINAVLPVAEKMLRKYGEFYPYGGYLRTDRTIGLLGVADPDSDYPKSKDVLFVLRDSLREMAERRECIAGAVVFDVKIVPSRADQESDAIQANIDHQDGSSVEVFFPYQLFNVEITYGKTFAQQGKCELFGN